MPAIIVSSDSPAVARSVAQSVATRLGWTCLGRELLAEVAERHGLQERVLARALDEHGARLGILNRTRDVHLSYIQAAVLERFVASNLVCEGLGAHLFVREIPHVLNLRVLEDLRQQVNRTAAEERVSPRRVRRQLERQAQRRQRWSKEVFGVDESNPAIYDMVISLGQIDVERVVKTVCDTIGDRRFQEMTYSRKCVEDRALAGRVRAALVRQFPSVRVSARDGTVTLALGRAAASWRKRAEQVKQLAEQVDGVDYVELQRATGVMGKEARNG
jgi:cytidylate kinase